MRRRRGADLRLLVVQERPVVALAAAGPGQRLRARVDRAGGDRQGLPHLARDRARGRRAGGDTGARARSKASRKRAVSGAMKEVAAFLGNTPTLARSAYVDPRVVDAYEEGRTIARATSRRYDTPDERQAALERATLRLIKEG